MPARSIFLFFISMLAACFAVYHIFAIALRVTPSTGQGGLLLNASFWFWVLLAWVSAYLLIRNYIILSESMTRQ